MRPNSRVGALMLALFCLVQLQMPAHADADFDEGMDNFQSKRFHAASQSFQKAVMKNPSNPAFHYYLGVSLQAIREWDSAKDEFTVAYKLNPFSTEGMKAREALLRASSEQGKAEHPADTPEMYARAVNDINRQSTDNKNRWIEYGNRNAAWSQYIGNLEGQKVLQEARSWAIDTRGRRHGAYDSQFVNDAQVRAQYMMSDGMVQGNLNRIQGTHAAFETQQSANTLKQLLSEQPKAGEPHLRALGTNLYVRNYSSFDDPVPEDPPLELRAKAKTFTDPLLPISEPGLHATAASWDSKLP